MWGLLLRLAGRRVVHKAVAHQAQRQGIDLKLGFALFRDKRVPLGSKVMAIGLAIAAMALLDLVELPAEAFLSMMLPILALPAIAFDGIENIVGPVLLSALFLNLTAPKPVVAQIRRERSGVADEVIDVESYPVNPAARVVA